MALPPHFLDGVQPESHGIGLNLIPGDPPGFQIELQRAPDVSGIPGTWATIVQLPPISVPVTYIDLLPMDNAYRHYRWRHTAPGYDPGAWSQVVKGKPVRLEGQAAYGGLMSLYPLRREKAMNDGKFALKASDVVGKETDDDLFISDTKTVKVGTVASPGSITKTLRIPHGEVVPFAQITTWQFTAAYVRPGSTGTTNTFAGSIVLPKGVTVTAVRARMYRQTTSDTAQVLLVRIADDGTTTTLSTLTHATTGWATVSGSVSQFVGDEAYTIQVSLFSNAVQADARFMWFELDYTMPSYDKGI